MPLADCIASISRSVHYAVRGLWPTDREWRSIKWSHALIGGYRAGCSASIQVAAMWYVGRKCSLAQVFTSASIPSCPTQMHTYPSSQCGAAGIYLAELPEDNALLDTIHNTHQLFHTQRLGPGCGRMRRICDACQRLPTLQGAAVG